MRFDDGEQAVVVIRKHWLLFAGSIITIALAAWLPLVLVRMLPAGIFSFIPAQIGEPTLAFVYMAWLLLLWLLLFALWTNFYLNIWIVTDRRVIDIIQRGLFSRELATTRLEKVQDVTIDTEGLLATVFDFGTLTIHTAGLDSDFIITDAAHPNRAREKILDAHASLLEQSLHQPQNEV